MHVVYKGQLNMCMTRLECCSVVASGDTLSLSRDATSIT